jgi:hypothetical protein
MEKMLYGQKDHLHWPDRRGFANEMAIKPVALDPLGFRRTGAGGLAGTDLSR